MTTRQPPVDYLQRTTDKYTALGFTPYGWVYSEDGPAFKTLDKPVSECRIGLVASGGIYVHGQDAFHYKDDFSYRRIHRDTPVRDLRATHFAYDLTDARRDPNVVFPLETLTKLESDGVIGELAESAIGFMGGIYSARKVLEQLAPAIADDLESQGVDAALLVPV